MSIIVLMGSLSIAVGISEAVMHGWKKAVEYYNRIKRHREFVRWRTRNQRRWEGV